MSTPRAERERTVLATDLGRKPYAEVWALQRRLVAARKDGRDHDRLLLVEHDPVITLGRRSREAHLLVDRDALAARGVPVFEVERGGDVTYHGPGQLVAYPVLDLRGHRKDVRWFAESLLAALVDTLGAFGLPATARGGVETGVWVGEPPGPVAKIAALGVRVERWVTFHGIALNVHPALEPFGWIVPCGLHGAPVTSMRACLGRPICLDDVKPVFVAAFGRAFGVATRAADVPSMACVPSTASAPAP